MKAKAVKASRTIMAAKRSSITLFFVAFIYSQAINIYFYGDATRETRMLTSVLTLPPLA